MSCSRAGTGHLISHYARHRMPNEDARAIYHAALAEFVAEERAAGQNPYEKVPSDEAIAFLRRQRQMVYFEGRERGQLEGRTNATLTGLDRRIEAIESGASSGNAIGWVTRAEIHAASQMPGLMASSTKCGTCGRFMAAGVGHSCPVARLAGDEEGRSLIVTADPSGAWGQQGIPDVMPERTFGIETEFTGHSLEDVQRGTAWDVVEDESVTGAGACDKCDDSMWLPCYNCGGYGCPECGDDGGETCPYCAGAEDSLGGELVSPILSGPVGVRLYHRHIAQLRELFPDVHVDESCGIHVHVGARDFTTATMTQLMRLWRRHEEAVFSLVDEVRRGGDYCKDLPDEYVKVMATADQRRQTISQAVNGMDRRSALNVSAYQRHGTVEYRLHHGSLDATETTDFAQFCVAFTEAATREATAEELAEVNGIHDVVGVLVRRGLLDRATGESLLARTGALPHAEVEPDSPTVDQALSA